MANQPPLRGTTDPFADVMPPHIRRGLVDSPKAGMSAMQQRELRERCVDMALRLPDHPDHQTVVKTAAAFEKFITEGHTNDQ